MLEKISIKKIEPVNKKDKKGYTYEWCNGLPGRQVAIYLRKKGVEFGNHFHKGGDPSKNPERFFLISGKIRMKAWAGKKQILNKVIAAGTEILIPPNIFHSSKAETDSIFIEYRSTVYNKKKNDSYPASEYEAYIKKIK